MLHTEKEFKISKIFWGNIIFGGIIGIAVDRSKSAGCQYPQQKNIYYPMKKHQNKF